MKKRLFAALVICVLLCALLSGCKKDGSRLPDVSYDNAPQSAYAYEIDGEEAVVTGFSAENTIANIPSELGGKPVTTIKSGAFKGNGILETVNLAPTVTTVENNVFAGCTSLRSVSLPPSLTSIGDEAFYGCTNLQILNLPTALTHIGARAFSGCTGLENIAFPADALYIGADAFAGTPWMAKQSLEFVMQNGSLLKYNGSRDVVTVPSGIKVVSSAFSGNETVEKVVLPDTVTHLTADAFSGCTALTSVSLGKAVTVIEDAAFSGCTALTEISIPKSVKAIGKDAFVGCTALTTVKGVKGSVAEKFATDKGLTFEAI